MATMAGKARVGRIRYENPPVIEAVCEFRFAQIGVQPALVPILYYDRIKAEYTEIEIRQGVGIQTGTEEVTMTTEDRTVFRNPSANRLVQIGPRMLAVNQLRPYPDYVTFRREIGARFSDYQAVAHPKGLTRLGLRYINRLTVPADQTLGALLQVGFKVPQALASNPDPYFLRLEFAYESDRDRLILIVAKAPDQPESPGGMFKGPTDEELWLSLIGVFDSRDPYFAEHHDGIYGPQS